jgi:hypothetical protein
MPKTKPAAKPAATRALSGAALKAHQAKAAKATAPAPHEHLVLTAALEVHDADGLRTFKAGPRSLPKALADLARARGLVAE